MKFAEEEVLTMKKWKDCRVWQYLDAQTLVKNKFSDTFYYNLYYDLRLGSDCNLDKDLSKGERND